MKIKKKMIEVYKDGKLVGIYDSIIKAIYDTHVSYASIRKSSNNDTYIKGYKFKFHINPREAVA